MGWFVAILSGVTAGLAYPTRFDGWFLPDLGFLGFFCWAPLMIAVEGGTLRRAFSLSFIAALFHFAISQFWLYRALHTFGGLSPTTSVAMLSLLLVVLSAYFGVIFLISGFLQRRWGISSLWIRPVVWVAVEYLRHIGPLGGYPWSQLGYTQGGFLPFIQSGDIWGAYGLTFLLVQANELTALAWRRLRGSELRPARFSILLAVLLLATNISYGYWRFSRPLPSPKQTLKVGVVQGNISQEEKWDRSRMQNIVGIYLEGTKKLEAQGAELILWPEASFPMTVSYDVDKIPFDFGNEKARLLFGAISRSANSPRHGTGATVFNSGLLINGNSEVEDYYHKRKLVPFGEYIPHQEFFAFARKLTAEVGNLQPGLQYRPISYGADRLGVLVCYEDIFPFIARDMVAQGAASLINITNDAWYGFSSAAYQHQVYSQYRSVETRRALIRATNTGISSLIDPYGRILWQGGLFIREDFLTELPLYHGQTLFVRGGYLLPHLFLMIMGAMVVGAWLFRRKKI
jgi:apolipoprotein N-acyltransferase